MCSFPVNLIPVLIYTYIHILCADQVETNSTPYLCSVALDPVRYACDGHNIMNTCEKVVFVVSRRSVG